MRICVIDSPEAICSSADVLVGAAEPPAKLAVDILHHHHIRMDVGLVARVEVFSGRLSLIFSPGSQCSLYYCCLGLMLIRFSSVCGRDHRRNANENSPLSASQARPRMVKQRHVAGERQQNADAIDWQRVSGHSRSRRASPALSGPRQIARHEPCCQKPLSPKNAAIAMDRDSIYPMGAASPAPAGSVASSGLMPPAQCDDQAEEQIQDGKSKQPCVDVTHGPDSLFPRAPTTAPSTNQQLARASGLKAPVAVRPRRNGPAEDMHQRIKAPAMRQASRFGHRSNSHSNGGEQEMKQHEDRQHVGIDRTVLQYRRVRASVAPGWSNRMRVLLSSARRAAACRG